MPTQSATATVRSRYAEQAASDLAENRRHQQELTSQLEALRQEETLLLDILSLAGHPAADSAHVPQQARHEPEPAAEQAPRSVPAPAAPDTSAEAPAEETPAERPAPAEGEDAAKAAAKPAKTAAKKRAAKSTPRAAGKTAAKGAPKSAAKTAAKATAGKTAGKAAAKKDESQALLRDLLLGLLDGHSEPRLAAELREELLRAHPDREPTPQVVRNTLEALVAKGRIQRHKQGRSVMYTVVGQAKDEERAGAA
ncbi:hypothetical protein [Streptomyces similanensis]|uniref:BlaI/MecI/CopY family transcriptional regulator n=1 Tax=Streptomyces similanensis TaxID=1274988 RepID=A0ABP9JQQ1_9ACTN